MGQLMARTVVVGLLLLTTPLQASAECAWVLWQEVRSGDAGEKLSWRPIAGHTALEQCESALKTAVANHVDVIKRGPGRQPPTVFNDGRSIIVPGLGGLPGGHAHYVCLPDTIDPRGPKER